VDLRLQSRNLIGAFQWNTNFLLSYNNSWITKSYREYTGPVSQLRPGAISFMEGSMAYPAYSYKWAGLHPETGQPMGYLNGEPSTDYRAIASKDNTKPEDLVLHGSARPL